MKLNLKQALALAGYDKSKYDARRLRGFHAFIHDHPQWDAGPVQEYENSRNRWGIEHVLALFCVDSLIETQGVSVETADSIVSNNMGQLAEAVRDGSIDPDDDLDSAGQHQHFLIGRIANVVGREHVSGTLDMIRHAVTRGAVHYDEHSDNWFAGLVLIDATTAYRRIKAKMVSAD